MTPKTLHRQQATVFLVAAIVATPLLVILSGATRGGIAFALIAGAYIFANVGYHWYKFKNTPDGAEFYDITKQPPVEQIRMSKKILWVMLTVGPFLSIVTYQSLSALEGGQNQHVYVWEVVAILYRLFGFWPAVLCWPLLCGYVAVLSFFRIERAKSVLQSQNA